MQYFWDSPNNRTDFSVGQKTAIETIENNIKNKKNHQTIYMPVGSGKTTIAIYIAKKLATQGKSVLLYYGERNSYFSKRINSEIEGYNKIVASYGSDIRNYQGLGFDFVIFENLFSFIDDDCKAMIETGSLGSMVREILKREPDQLSIGQKSLINIYCLTRIIESNNAKTLHFCVPVNNGRHIEFDYYPVITSVSWLKQTNSVKSNEEFVHSNIEIFDKLFESVRSPISETREFAQELIKVLFQNAAFQEITQDIKEIKQHTKDINSKLNSLSDQVGCCQSLIKRQIEHINDESEKEHIISTFVDECVERIEMHISNNTNTEEKTIIVDLMNDLGEETWLKLKPESRSFLISSTLIFNTCYPKENFDYSTVCLPIIKTLELELKSRFYFDFLTFLSHKPDMEISQYPYALLNNGKKREAHLFTLGSFAYLFGVKVPQSISSEKHQKDKDLLIDFCQSTLFKATDRQDIIKLTDDFGKQIEEIKERYRDEFAHTGILNAEQAQKCRDWIIVSRKLLKIMMESFRY